MKTMLIWALLLFKCSFFSFFLILLLSWTSPSGQTTSAKKIEDKVSKAVEVFVGRIRKMENDFIRYEMSN